MLSSSDVKLTSWWTCATYKVTLKINANYLVMSAHTILSCLTFKNMTGSTQSRGGGTILQYSQRIQIWDKKNELYSKRLLFFKCYIILCIRLEPVLKAGLSNIVYKYPIRISIVYVIFDYFVLLGPK